MDGGEVNLAEALLAMGYVEEAVSECERLMAQNSSSPLLHFRYAQALQQRGDAERARAEYQRFLDAWKSADRDLPEVVIAERALASE